MLTNVDLGETEMNFVGLGEPRNRMSFVMQLGSH